MADEFRKQGAFSWFELSTTDVRVAETFYTRLFGWTTEPWTGDESYRLIKVDGKEVGGMVQAPSGETATPAGWGIYITVTDVDATARKTTELGGKVLVKPTNFPRVGRFCVIEDPEGGIITAITYARG